MNDDTLALRLYAAYLDIAAERIPEFCLMAFPDRTIADWGRVADEALGVRQPRPIAPARPAEKPKRSAGRPKRATITCEPIWCAQCDRRVPVPQIKLCGSQFCSAKAVLP